MAKFSKTQLINLHSLSKAMEVNPFALYSPTPAQKQFHESTSKRRLLRAGNRVGKTYAGAYEAWYRAINYPGERGLIVAADWSGYKDVIAPTLWDLAPKHMLASDCEFSPGRGWRGDRIVLKNGSQMIFRSGESKTKGVSGIRAHWLWIDEPPEKNKFGEILSRVAFDEGPAWMTFTPIGAELSWLKEKVSGEGSPWEEILAPLNAANCPHRTAASIAAQIADYSPWEINQRVFAEWEGITVDRALEGFSEDSVDDHIPKLSWEIGLGMDHGELAGHQICVLVLINKSKNLVWVLDEYVSTKSTTPEEDAVEIRKMLSRHNFDPISIDHAVGDTNSAGKGSGGRVNKILGDQLQIRISNPDKSPGSVEWGTRLLNIFLKRGNLKVHSRCLRTAASLKHWRGGNNEEWKHIIDGLRYVLVPQIEGMLRGPELDRIRLLRA